MNHDQKFNHSKSADGAFKAKVLRSYFEYRDLGISEASNGKVVAHVIRAREGHNATGNWHVHNCDFQMLFVLKGWARFEYDGIGIRKFEPGDCILQPAGIKHRELEHSADFEIIEIVSPAEFGSTDV